VNFLKRLLLLFDINPRISSFKKGALRKVFAFRKVLMGSGKERMKKCKIGGIFGKIAI